MGRNQAGCAKIRNGQSAALSERVAVLFAGLSERWQAGVEQQPSWVQHQALYDRPEEFPVCQHPRWRPEQRGDLQLG